VLSTVFKRSENETILMENGNYFAKAEKIHLKEYYFTVFTETF